MSYNGQLVVDMDCHIREYWDLDRTFKGYVDPEYRDKYDRLSAAVRANQRRPGDTGFVNVIWPRSPARPLGLYDPFEADAPESRDRTRTGRSVEIDPACNWDPTVRLRDMDRAGIDVGVMFASQSDGFCTLRDVGFESALHRAFHRSMSAYCAESVRRLRWVGAPTMRNVPETVEQLRYWTEHDESFAGMSLRRACPDGRQLDNPDLHPLFEASQELDMPIWVHGVHGNPPLTPWPEGPNPIYHSWGGQYALAALIGGGVFDLFPRLRIGLFESLGDWMPWFIGKLDEAYTPGSAQTPRLKRSPSEIVASGQFFCSLEADEEHAEYAVQAMGEDLYVFTTDYPHSGCPWPDGVPMITERKGLAESAKVKWLGENAKRFMPSLAAVAP